MFEFVFVCPGGPQGVLRGLDGWMTNSQREKQSKQLCTSVQHTSPPALNDIYSSCFLWEENFCLARSQAATVYSCLPTVCDVFCCLLPLLSHCIKLDLKSSLRGIFGKRLCSWILVFRRFLLMDADTTSEPKASGLRCIINAAALSDVFFH